MKRILRVILSLSAFSISSLTSLVTIACGDLNLIVDPNVEIYSKYYNVMPDNPYLDFINNSNKVLKSPVIGTENQKFNALYDDGTALRTWNDISSLELL